MQSFDLTGPVRVPYDVNARFGLLDLADLGEAATTVLLDDGHVGWRCSPTTTSTACPAGTLVLRALLAFDH